MTLGDLRRSTDDLPRPGMLTGLTGLTGLTAGIGAPGSGLFTAVGAASADAYTAIRRSAGAAVRAGVPVAGRRPVRPAVVPLAPRRPAAVIDDVAPPGGREWVPVTGAVSGLPRSAVPISSAAPLASGSNSAGKSRVDGFQSAARPGGSSGRTGDDPTIRRTSHRKADLGPGPHWFGFSVSTPVQVVAVPRVSAPVAVPVGPATGSTASAAGSTGRGWAIAATPGGGGACRPGIAGATVRRRFTSTRDREIEPATRALLARPSVAPPRSAPRALPTAGLALLRTAPSGTAPATPSGTVPGQIPAGGISGRPGASTAPPLAVGAFGALGVPGAVVVPGAVAGGPPVPDAATVRPAGATGGSAASPVRRSSLLDIPASLFERARTQLPGAAIDRSQNPGTQHIRRSNDVTSPEILPGANGAHGGQQPGSIAASLTPREWDELVDIIVERLEDRVSDELSRRGRRFTPGVM